MKDDIFWDTILSLSIALLFALFVGLPTLVYLAENEVSSKSSEISSEIGGAFMISEKECKNNSELFQLIKENPDLPIVPMVSGEIAADDNGYWLGSWGSAKVDEYIILNRNNEVHYRSDDDVFYALEMSYSDEAFAKLPESEEACRPFYDALPWTKAIIICIEPLY